jgi:hypothetical protein
MARTDKYPGQELAKTGLIKGKQGIYEESSTAKHTVGERMCLGDGRVFYYAKMGSTGAVRPGVMLAANLDQGEADTSVTESIGDKTIAAFTTVGAMGPNSVGGYFNCTTGTGQGQTHKIADVTQSTTSGASDIHLHDELNVALSSATGVIVHNPFFAVEVPTDAIQMRLGVALIATTANYYFWLQTYGWVGLLRGDSLGDLATERELQATGVSVLSTNAGVIGAQLLGWNTYYSTDVTTSQWHLGFLNIWP